MVILLRFSTKQALRAIGGAISNNINSYNVLIFIPYLRYQNGGLNNLLLAHFFITRISTLRTVYF